MSNDYSDGPPAASGFGGYFTRTFSIVTFLIGIGMAVDPAEFGLGSQGPDEIPADVLIPVLIILGLHGMLTKMSEVGVIRRLLCYLSGVAGAVVVFNVVSQLMS